MAARQQNRQTGFTIVELMIATAVFSTILLIVAAGVLSFSRQYQKGVINNHTQTVATSIINQLSHDIQFSNTPNTGVSNSGNNYCLQIGNNLYVYQIGTQLEPVAAVSNYQAKAAFIVVPAGSHSCTVGGVTLDPTTAAGYSGAHELLSQDMRLTKLTISPNDSLYTVNLSLVYGDYDLLSPRVTSGMSPAPNWSNEQCAGNSGDEYCSKVSLQTIVAQRL